MSSWDDRPELPTPSSLDDDDVRFWWSFFFYKLWFFGVMSKNSLPNPRSQKLPLVFYIYT
jgi:hypothetical protein